MKVISSQNNNPYLLQRKNEQKDNLFPENDQGNSAPIDPSLNSKLRDTVILQLPKSPASGSAQPHGAIHSESQVASQQVKLLNEASQQPEPSPITVDTGQDGEQHVIDPSTIASTVKPQPAPSSFSLSSEPGPITVATDKDGNQHVIDPSIIPPAAQPKPPPPSAPEPGPITVETVVNGSQQVMHPEKVKLLDIHTEEVAFESETSNGMHSLKHSHYERKSRLDVEKWHSPFKEEAERGLSLSMDKGQELNNGQHMLTVLNSAIELAKLMKQSELAGTNKSPEELQKKLPQPLSSDSIAPVIYLSKLINSVIKVSDASNVAADSKSTLSQKMQEGIGATGSVLNTAAGAIKTLMNENKENPISLKAIVGQLEKGGSVIGGLMAMEGNIKKLYNPQASTADKIAAGLSVVSTSVEAAELGFGVGAMLVKGGAAGAFLSAGSAIVPPVAAALAISTIAANIGVAINEKINSETKNGLLRNVRYDSYNSGLALRELERKLDGIDNKLLTKHGNNQPRNVTTNNNVADLFQMMASPNYDKTASGQYLADDTKNEFRFNLFEKYSDVTLASNYARTGVLIYDPNSNLPSVHKLFLGAGQHNYEQDRASHYGAQSDLTKAYNDQGYSNVGPDNLERFYQIRNTRSDGSAYFQPEHHLSASQTMTAGSPYINKTVDNNGSWDLIRISDQAVMNKESYPQMEPPIPLDPEIMKNPNSYDSEVQQYIREMDRWQNAFPLDATTPTIRSPNTFSRMINTSGDVRTSIEMDNVRNPVNINLKHSQDSIVFNQLPEADIEITAKKGSAPKIDYAYAGADQSAPQMSKMVNSDTAVYTFSNGKRMIVNYHS